MIIEVPVPEGFQFDSVVRSHGWCQLLPFSLREDTGELVRIHHMKSGQVVRLTFRGGKTALEVQVDGDGVSESEPARQELYECAITIFQLDQDLEPFYSVLQGQARYQWVEGVGAGRLLRCPTVWEDLVKTLMTTNTAWGATRKMVERAVALGDELKPGQSCFPSPGAIASYSVPELKETVRAGYRTGYLHELASRINEGDLDVEPWTEPDLPSETLYDHLLALKGFGPYAAGVVMKLLGRHDRLSLDTSARTMFKREFRPDGDFNDADIQAHYQEFGEWRGLVLWMDLLRPYLDETS